LNGVKAWVSSAPHAGVIICMARSDRPNDRKGPRGISAFVVTPDLPGFTIGKKEDKMGLRASPTVQLHFDNVRVPNANLLGEAGMGFVYSMESLEHGRLGVAAQALGIARSALEHATAYAAERKQFGKPIKEFQAIQFKLADMATRVEASRLLTRSAAERLDAGDRADVEAGMAKLFASETALEVSTEAMRIHGGYGYTTEFPVERYYRDAPLMIIGEGTNEIQRMVIARGLLRRWAANPGAVGH
jgi:hypothetical protein